MTSSSDHSLNFNENINDKVKQNLINISLPIELKLLSLAPEDLAQNHIGFWDKQAVSSPTVTSKTSNSKPSQNTNKIGPNPSNISSTTSYQSSSINNGSNINNSSSHYYRNFNDWRSHLIYYKQIKGYNRNLPEIIKNSIRKHSHNFYKNNRDNQQDSEQRDAQQSEEENPIARVINYNKSINNSDGNEDDIPKLFRNLLKSELNQNKTSAFNVKNNKNQAPSNTSSNQNVNINQNNNTATSTTTNNNSNNTPIRNNNFIVISSISQLNQANQSEKIKQTVEKLQNESVNESPSDKSVNITSSQLVDMLQNSSNSNQGVDLVEGERAFANSNNKENNSPSNNPSNNIYNDINSNSGSLLYNFKQGSWSGPHRSVTNIDFKMDLNSRKNEELNKIPQQKCIPYTKGTRAGGGVLRIPKTEKKINFTPNLINNIITSSSSPSLGVNQVIQTSNPSITATILQNAASNSFNSNDYYSISSLENKFSNSSSILNVTNPLPPGSDKPGRKVVALYHRLNEDNYNNQITAADLRQKDPSISSNYYSNSEIASVKSYKSSKSSSTQNINQPSFNNFMANNLPRAIAKKSHSRLNAQHQQLFLQQQISINQNNLDYQSLNNFVESTVLTKLELAKGRNESRENQTKINGISGSKFKDLSPTRNNPENINNNNPITNSNNSNNKNIISSDRNITSNGTKNSQSNGETNSNDILNLVSHRVKFQVAN